MPPARPPAPPPPLAPARPLAIVRGLPESFSAALGQRRDAPPIDLPRARRQHADYCAALEALGFGLLALPAEEALPDCCFVEDTAVVVGATALLARPGAPSRRAEVDAIAEALAPYCAQRRVPPGACLDGGDALLVGDTLFIGRSLRSDAGGLAAARAAFEPLGCAVVSVEVAAGVLHLKCHASSPLPDLVLAAEGEAATLPWPPGVTVVPVPRREAYAANAIGRGARVVVAAGYPETAARLRAEGLDVILLDTSEFALADGSLTCLSVLLDGGVA